MGLDNIHSGCFITCVYDKYSPFGEMVRSFETLEEAKDHIRYQREEMHSDARWNILHIKDMEWL